MVKVRVKIAPVKNAEPKSVWLVSEGDGLPLSILFPLPWRLISGVAEQVRMTLSTKALLEVVAITSVEFAGTPVNVKIFVSK